MSSSDASAGRVGSGMLIFLHLIQVTSSLYVNSFLRTNAFYSTLSRLSSLTCEVAKIPSPSWGVSSGAFSLEQCSAVELAN
jgi:hypothetical protein